MLTRIPQTHSIHALPADIPSKWQTGRAFSLIELLVVCVVIVLLLALVTPALTRAGEATHLTVCASNLSDLGHSTQLYMTDYFGQYPGYTALGISYTRDVLKCPNDYDPAVIPGGVFNGVTAPLRISYGLNIEYKLHNIRASTTPSSALKAVLYDGLSGAGGFTESGIPTGLLSGGTTQNGKFTIIHIPPGNPGNAHAITIDDNAAPAHVGHGDLMGYIPPGTFSYSSFLEYNFVPRHRMGTDVGNILYADFHVGNARQLDDTALLYPNQ